MSDNAILSRLKVNLSKFAIPVACLLCMFTAAACYTERPTKVVLGGDSVPTFRLSGSGKLGTFLVYLLPPSPEKMEKSILDETPAWSIVAQPDWLHGQPVEAIGELTYGSVPAGYSEPNPAQRILPGRVYYFECDSTDAPEAHGFFRIENGKTVSATAQLPCMTTRGGKVVWGPCPEVQ